MTDSMDHNDRRERAGRLPKPIAFVGGCAGIAWFVSPPTKNFGQFVLLRYMFTVLGFVLTCALLAKGIVPSLKYIDVSALSFRCVEIAAVVGIGCFFVDNLAAGAIAEITDFAAVGLFYFRGA